MSEPLEPPQEEESPTRPVRNGVKSSLGDLQGVDLLRGFEKISSWREGGSPVKEHLEVNSEGRAYHHRDEHVFGQELAKIPIKAVDGVNGVNGNGVDCGLRSVSSREEDSQMTDVKMEG